MTWFWLACVALGSIGIGLILGFKGAALLFQPTIQDQNLKLALDRNFALTILRRELANWLFRRDPDRNLQIYREALGAVTAIDSMNRTEQYGQRAGISKKFPWYVDFDLIDSHDYTLYADALSWSNYDEIANHYTTIIRFQALQVAINEDWPRQGPISDKELSHLENYVRKYKDTQLKRRLKAAIHEFYTYRQYENESLKYETATLIVRRVYHFAENRYGVHFKDTGEFGLYGFFFADNRDEPFTNFYRSNADFTEETWLDDMRINEPPI